MYARLFLPVRAELPYAGRRAAARRSPLLLPPLRRWPCCRRVGKHAHANAPYRRAVEMIVAAFAIVVASLAGAPCLPMPGRADAVRRAHGGVARRCGRSITSKPKE
ncbi:hypothetical protein [Candidatus Accumulibacter sp. ACC003]|uniref:hypothetical protein n=1 Tax=Candidatus Accumulibacter sp. ACC003 TaxID=2823334 RepID=UPI0025C40E86|nr:hypothetical protein [Candidatus Accumulibacter sp. ACC003]